MNEKDKIKKEIAERHGFLSGYSIQSRSDFAQRDLYALMDEYAKERLLAFLDWREQHSEETVDREWVDEFLNL